MPADRFGAIRNAASRLAREVNTVAQVAKRPSQQTIESRQMIARLEEWGAVLWSMAEHASLGLNENIETRKIEAELAALPSPMESFDAAVWAKSFVDHVRLKPSIATDEGTMLAWFAGAIMRGFDEHAKRERQKREALTQGASLMDTQRQANIPAGVGQGAELRRRDDVRKMPSDPLGDAHRALESGMDELRRASNDSIYRDQPTSQGTLANIIILLDQARAQASRLRQQAPDVGSTFGVIRETQRVSMEAYLTADPSSARSPLLMLQAAMDRVRFGLSAETAYLTLVELAAACQIVAERTYPSGMTQAAEAVKREASLRITQTRRVMESRREIQPAYGALGRQRGGTQASQPSQPMNEVEMRGGPAAPEFERYDRDRDNPVPPRVGNGPDGVR